MVIPSDEIYTLKREVLNVTNETSDKFVFAPTKEQILADLIIGLKRFRNTVRWKWFFLEEKRKKNELENSPLSQNALDSKFSFSDESDKSDVDDNYNNETGIITSSDLMKKREGLRSGLAQKKYPRCTNWFAGSRRISE